MVNNTALPPTVNLFLLSLSVTSVIRGFASSIIIPRVRWNASPAGLQYIPQPKQQQPRQTRHTAILFSTGSGAASQLLDQRRPIAAEKPIAKESAEQAQGQERDSLYRRWHVHPHAGGHPSLHGRREGAAVIRTVPLHRFVKGNYKDFCLSSPTAMPLRS